MVFLCDEKIVLKEWFLFLGIVFFDFNLDSNLLYY